MSLHDERFPGESAQYRAARDRLLEAEMALRRKVEEVAALRRTLPPGGVVPEDYVFEEVGGGGSVKMSELFVKPQASLVVYSYMYGPAMAKPCPMCTSMLDSLDGTAKHAGQRINLAVVAKSPPARIAAIAAERGWRNLRLLSAAQNSYTRDYHGETEAGAQLPTLNVFARKDGATRHMFATELLFAPAEQGQNDRHIDMIWPLWNLFDFTQEGRGVTWYPSLSYS